MTSTTELPEISRQIRAAIQDDHNRIEATSAARALLEGTIDRERYARLLAQLHFVHAALEAALERRPEPRLAGLGGSARAAAIARDLTVLGVAVAAKLPETRAAIEFIDDSAARGPWHLVGCVHVLEGSRMGGLILSRPLARALGVPCELGRGLDYHLEGADAVPTEWREFKETLDALADDAAAREATTAGARGLMARLTAVYGAL